MANAELSPTTSTSLVSLLQASNINFLACDFDLTLIDIHTSGNWLGTIPDLCTHVRPNFTKLIGDALRTPGMHVAIVTFSPQTAVVRDVCREVWGDLSDKIVIRGGDRTWSYEGGGSQDRKQSHMASAVEELLSIDPTATVTRATTLLLDDDADNIKVALREGVRAVWINPREPDKMEEHLRELLGTGT